MRGTRPAVPVVAAAWGAVALSAAVVPLLESTDSLPALYVAIATAGPFIALCAYRHAPVGAEVTEERRRIARELHDGPAQELAYLLRHLDELDGTIDAKTRENLRTAAERAHSETRLAIKNLSRPRRERVGVTVARAVGEVAARDRIGLELDIARDLLLPAPRAEALVRIACEAVRNAARHSGSGQVALSVQPLGPRVQLRVSDSGRGFDPAAPHGGFGLASMHERARLAGGELYIHSVPGGGTEVEGTL